MERGKEKKIMREEEGGAKERERERCEVQPLVDCLPGMEPANLLVY